MGHLKRRFAAVPAVSACIPGEGDAGRNRYGDQRALYATPAFSKCFFSSFRAISDPTRAQTAVTQSMSATNQGVDIEVSVAR